MDLESLTVKEVRSIQALLASSKESKSRWQVGRSYLIKTVTEFVIGTLIEVTPKEFWLKDACWVADTGRFTQFLKDGVLNEIEPYPDGMEVSVGRGALITACVWPHALPRSQK